MKDNNYTNGFKSKVVKDTELIIPVSATMLADLERVAKLRGFTDTQEWLKAFFNKQVAMESKPAIKDGE